MGDMICSKCHTYGIYWRDLHTNSPYTYCPHCKGINCQAEQEIKQEDVEQE